MKTFQITFHSGEIRNIQGIDAKDAIRYAERRFGRVVRVLEVTIK